MNGGQGAAAGATSVFSRVHTHPSASLALPASTCVEYVIGTHWVQWALDSTQTGPYTVHSMQSPCHDQRKHTSAGPAVPHTQIARLIRDRHGRCTRCVQGMQAAQCDTWVAWCVGCTQAAPPKPSHAYGRCGPRSTKHLHEYGNAQSD
jgi:hypothetical protein